MIRIKSQRFCCKQGWLSSDFPYAEMVSHILPLADARRGFDALDGSYQLDGDTVIKIALRGAAHPL
jgi:hypothetical protein